MVKSAQMINSIDVSEQQQRSELSSKYKGVRKRKWGKWVSEIRLPNSRERIWLGSYDSPEKAARAFDAALFCLRGRNAKFNFPETPPEIAGGQSLSPQEIQVVAASFANDVIDKVEQPKDPPSDLGYQNDASSSSLSDGFGAVQADCSDMAIDWSFLGLLDSNHNVYDFDHFSGGLHCCGELSHPLPLLGPASHDTCYDRCEENGDEAFSQHSFLWNF
ncbi:ethylene-responsive transcription factor ERF017 [Ziziphus jujuba]|uniref:Ethylene-responsive transcription factor ERF017 n=2 Tax=Ziziphus jujuba TaxID=326968 RepID=A0A6P3ZT51_ZIZJJ|nr:ethylene-responsive transcription factor ERF017 [Ziziphus jujuba]KAH7523898.1 hypothetical protein FEM48_Zijuj06G0060900 [Ziziphus jujuba var. spinosa]